MSRTWSTRRKSLAIGLAVVGVAGLSLASASQLGLNWGTQTLQSGTVQVKTDCQVSPITATYDVPTFDGSKTNPWTMTNVVHFTGIDTNCDGKKYEAAYKTNAANATWTNADLTVAGTTPSQLAVSAPGGTINVALPAGVDPTTISSWALTIHS